MAERVDDSLLTEGRGRSAIYPWDQWFDGSTWKLVAGTDFQCSIAGIRSSAHASAKRRGGGRDQPSVVFVRFSARLRGTRATTPLSARPVFSLPSPHLECLRGLRPVPRRLDMSDFFSFATVQPCRSSKCLIPRPHRHTGVFTEDFSDEWWCPTSQRWVWCPGPCPDGTPHEEKRRAPIKSERVELLS